MFENADLSLKMGDPIYLPGRMADRFSAPPAGYVRRVFVAPAVRNPFNLSSAPLRGDTRCAEILFYKPARLVIVDLSSNSLAQIADPATGKRLTLYVGVHNLDEPQAPVPLQENVIASFWRGSPDLNRQAVEDALRSERLS